jgi:hypothetical protein
MLGFKVAHKNFVEWFDNISVQITHWGTGALSSPVYVKPKHQ